MYKSEKGGPFYRSLSYLKLIYQIPFSADKSAKKKFYRFFLLTKVGSIFCTTIGPALHLIVSVMSHSSQDISEDISMTFGATGAGMVSVLFALKYQEWSEFFNEIVDTSSFGKPKNFDKTINHLNRLAKICFFGGSWVTIIYGLAAFSKGCKTTNEGIEEICPTFSPLWLPFGANDPTIGTIIFVIQTIFMGVFTAQPFLMECYIVYESTEVLVCYINDLKHHFKMAFDASSPAKMRNRLRFCVDYHVHILNLGYRLGALIKYTTGHMSLLSAFVCGLIANQMLNTKPMGSIIFLIAWLFALLCACHSGQRIKDQTLSIADAVWESKWYKSDVTTLKDVQFILLRCQKPIYFEAWPVGVTDYPFYFMMIRTGYSYFALFHKSMDAEKPSYTI